MDVGLVCDACHAFNPMGVAQCARCSAALALDPPRSKVQPAASPTAATLPPRATGDLPSATCPTCRAPVPMGHRFCFNCGGKMPEFSVPEETQFRASPLPDPDGGPRSTAFFGAMQAARAKLTLIRGDGLDGVSFTLAGDEHLAGRIDCPLLFPDDPFLSPVHANFFYREGALVVRDERSVNGVYLRIGGSVAIPFGTRFLVGEQVLEVVEPPRLSDDAEPDGTYFYASPRRPAQLRIIQHLRGGSVATAVHTATDTATLGREGNDLNFPDDPFISGRHAQVQLTPSGPILSDLGSRNGTFVRIAGERTLAHGDYLFMGQQLLRVEIV